MQFNYNTFSKGLLFLKDKNYRFLVQARYGRFDNMSDEEYIRNVFKARFGKELDLLNPQTYSEKLQWLKLYYRKPELTDLVDKFKVREYVCNRIGEEFLIPLLGVWEKSDEIDLEELPNKFVLKCNHNSGLGMCICRDKNRLKIEKVKKELDKGIKQNYYLLGREWPYKDVKRKIIAEEFITDSDENTSKNCQYNEGLKDYKFFCFDGEVKCFKIDYDRFTYHRANYYDAKTKDLLHFGEKICPPDYSRKIEIPYNIDQMIRLAEILSKGFPFVRVDLYNCKGKIYFGEMTFFPDSGFGEFVPNKWDQIFGTWIHLPM